MRGERNSGRERTERIVSPTLTKECNPSAAATYPHTNRRKVSQTRMYHRRRLPSIRIQGEHIHIGWVCGEPVAEGARGESFATLIATEIESQAACFAVGRVANRRISVNEMYVSNNGQKETRSISAMGCLRNFDLFEWNFTWNAQFSIFFCPPPEHPSCRLNLFSSCGNVFDFILWMIRMYYAIVTLIRFAKLRMAWCFAFRGMQFKVRRPRHRA